MTNEISNRGQTNPLSITDAVLYSRLADAIAWCSHILKNSTLTASMRSSELAPQILHEGRDDVVCNVISSRHWRIRETTDTPATVCPDLLGGRLVTYFPDADLCDGAAQAESDGFFDAFNVPPWDTWVAYFEDNPGASGSYDNYLLAYVPQPFVPLVEGGISVNPEQCIMWLSDADVKVRARFVARKHP